MSTKFDNKNVSMKKYANEKPLSRMIDKELKSARKLK
jgi:hypothetical protein